MEKIGNIIRQPVQNTKPKPTKIHSELHEVVAKLRKDFGETATKGKGSFGFYLGLLRRVPISTLYVWHASVLDSPKLNTGEARGKVFWWKYKQYFHPDDKKKDATIKAEQPRKEGV